MNQVTKTSMTILSRSLLILMLSLEACPSASGDELGQAVQAAIQKVEPSIVRLRVIGGEQSIDGDAVTSLVTTGLVISEDGEILTSQFALEGNPEAVLVEDQSGKRINATVIATDNVRRIVLLKAKDGRWTPVRPEVDQSVEVGQWSIALGRFYEAESSSVSVGIISALNRIHGMAIQTDAKVSPVNYGGPLVLLNGTIAGILVPLSPRGGASSSGIEWYDSGIGFAIPLKDALESAEKLRVGENLEPGKIGIRLASAGAFDSNIVIDRVLPGGPSERAGLLKGDRILTIDAKPLERSSVLMESIASRYAGDSVTFRLQRGGAEITAVVELVKALSPVPQGYLGLLRIPQAMRDNSTEADDKVTDENLDRDEDGCEGQPGRLLKIPRLKPSGTLQPNDSTKEQPSDSVPLVVVNNSPASEQITSTGIELLSINGKGATSLSELATAIEEIVPGTLTKIEYRVPGTTVPKLAEISAGTRPEVVAELSEAVLEQIRKLQSSVVQSVDAADTKTPSANASDATESTLTDGVSRREFNFEERGRCVVLSSTNTSSLKSGVVILLSAHDTSEEVIARDWKPVLGSHCLTLIVPKSPESARLTKDDIPLVMTSLRAVVSRSGADLRRVVVVADREQSSLAWQCAFGGPSVVRGIALTDGWVADSEIRGVEGAGHSVLLFDQTKGTQAKALREISLKSLKDAGFWVPQPSSSVVPDSGGEQIARCVADWTFLMPSF